MKIEMPLLNQTQQSHATNRNIVFDARRVINEASVSDASGRTETKCSNTQFETSHAFSDRQTHRYWGINE
jgi:hypothetical protein